jgi:Lrp/AsnC family transcriptional regulator, leucine-responsive regulatory protein
VSSSNSPADPAEGLVEKTGAPIDVDRQLMAALARDGRASFTELAERVGLSVSAVHQRVRRLEQRGLITGYSAHLDASALGLPLTAFVAITPIEAAQPDDAPARLAHLSAIEECHSVAGVESYLLKVRVPSPDALEALLAQIRAAANVSTRTTVVLSTYYEDRPPI